MPSKSALERTYDNRQRETETERGRRRQYSKNRRKKDLKASKPDRKLSSTVLREGIDPPIPTEENRPFDREIMKLRRIGSIKPLSIGNNHCLGPRNLTYENNTKGKQAIDEGQRDEDEIQEVHEDEDEDEDGGSDDVLPDEDMNAIDLDFID
ncbi:hypothetical protein LguiB_020969 [Lonicera macranthoides]